MRVSCLVLAAGSSTRFGGEVPKVYLPLNGRRILERSMDRLQQLIGKLRQDGGEGELIVAVRPQDREEHLAGWIAPWVEHGLILVDGGETRVESMRNALAASNPDHDLVLVHDAARPFFPLTSTEAAIIAADEIGAAFLAVPVPDTLRRVDENGRVLGTVDRTGMHLAQTPQILKRSLLERALSRDDASNCTDDMELVERLGEPVQIVPGSRQNLKVTMVDDIPLARVIAAQEDGE